MLQKDLLLQKHLVNNSDCTNNYNMTRFKIIKNLFSFSDLIQLEIISIQIRKPILCKHKDSDYTLSLLS